MVIVAKCQYKRKSADTQGTGIWTVTGAIE